MKNKPEAQCADLGPQNENPKPCDKMTQKNTTPPSRKERLWDLLGVFFYLCVAIGAVYHLVLGH